MSTLLEVAAMSANHSAFLSTSGLSAHLFLPLSPASLPKQQVPILNFSISTTVTMSDHVNPFSSDPQAKPGTSSTSGPTTAGRSRSNTPTNRAAARDRSLSARRGLIPTSDSSQSPEEEQAPPSSDSWADDAERHERESASEEDNVTPSSSNQPPAEPAHPRELSDDMPPPALPPAESAADKAKRASDKHAADIERLLKAVSKMFNQPIALNMEDLAPLRAAAPDKWQLQVIHNLKELVLKIRSRPPSLKTALPSFLCRKPIPTAFLLPSHQQMEAPVPSAAGMATGTPPDTPEGATGKRKASALSPTGATPESKKNLSMAAFRATLPRQPTDFPTMAAFKKYARFEFLRQRHEGSDDSSSSSSSYSHAATRPAGESSARSLPSNPSTSANLTPLGQGGAGTSHSMQVAPAGALQPQPHGMAASFAHKAKQAPKSDSSAAMPRRTTLMVYQVGDTKIPVTADDFNSLRRSLVAFRKTDLTLSFHGAEHRSCGGVALFVGNTRTARAVDVWLADVCVGDRSFHVWTRPASLRVGFHLPYHLCDEATEVVESCVELHNLRGSFHLAEVKKFKNAKGKEYRILNLDMDTSMTRSLLEAWEQCEEKGPEWCRLSTLDSSFICRFSMERARVLAPPARHNMSRSPSPSPREADAESANQAQAMDVTEEATETEEVRVTEEEATEMAVDEQVPSTSHQSAQP